MFDSDSWQRLSGTETSRVLGVHLGHVPYLEEDRPEERRVLRRAVVLAVVAHVALFLVTLPASKAKVYRVGSPQEVFVVKPVRFQPPPPAAARQEIPKPRTRRIPIPDPTPDDPEPIVLEEVTVPTLVPASDEAAFYGIPDGPPGPGFDATGAVRLSGDIAPPVKIHYPTPRYTEAGRLARIEGVVILEVVVDERGDVTGARVLKGLPHGLAESAVETAMGWKFRPALRSGQPVKVLVTITVRFSLQ